MFGANSEANSQWDSPGKMVKGVTLTLGADVVLEGAYQGCSIAVSEYINSILASLNFTLRAWCV